LNDDASRAHPLRQALERLRLYLDAARGKDPEVIFRRGAETLRRDVKRALSQLRDRMREPGIDDAELLAACRPPASDLADVGRRLSGLGFGLPFDPDRDGDALRALYERPAWREARERLIERGERAVRHEVDLLGSGPHAFGEHIDWHVDWKSGARWPRGSYYHDYVQIRMDGSDVKLPWELSRCHHLVAAAQASVLTRDPRFAKEVCAQIRDWIAENTVAHSINWKCAMDVAIRAANWVVARRLLGRTACVSATFDAALARSLLEHARFILANLERVVSPVGNDFRELNSNHFLSDVAGLVYIGAALPFIPEAVAAARFGRDELRKEALLQVHESGVVYEHSTGYHRLSFELLLYPEQLLDAAGDPTPGAVGERLARATDFIAAYTRPDGSLPRSGDWDDGRFLTFGEGTLTDHRYLLATAAVVFDRADLAVAAGGVLPEETVWLLGPAAADRLERLRSQASPAAGGSVMRAFEPPGFFCLRDDTRGLHLFVDAADSGRGGVGGHDHNDRFHFDYHAAGTTWIADPGTYVYSSDPVRRNRLRATAAHATVRVDGVEQNTLGGGIQLWVQRNEAAPQRREHGNRDGVIFVQAEHHGYARLEQPVTHRRRFELDGASGRLRVKDVLEGRGEHLFEWFLPFGADVERVDVEQAEGGRRCFAAYRGDGCCRVALIDLLAGAELAVEPGEASPSYGELVPIRVGSISLRARLPVRLTMDISADAGPDRG
jgi:hypothetical protein